MSENLLNEDESKALSESAKTVKERPYLTLSVFPMLVDSIERKEDRNKVAYLRVNFDTGYQKKDGGTRLVNQIFYLSGEYPDGRKKIDDLAKFLKVCFKISVITEATLKSILKKKVAVATRKDPDGFIQFWYAENIENYKSALANYKPKREEANFQRESEKPNTPPADFMREDVVEEPRFLAGVELPEDEETEDDGLPFK
jgi:hypothetical protein